MDLVEAIRERKSIRAFKPDPVPMDILKEIFEQALRAPSWANTQPWELAIVTGKQLKEIKEGFLAKGEQIPAPDIARPYEFPEPYSFRLPSRYRKPDGEAEKLRRQRNFRNYGAPVVAYLLIGRSFFYQAKGINVWSLYDCGPMVQNIMLLATSYGLGTIAQAQAVAFPDVIRKVVGIPESKLIALGIGIGYPDWDDAVNQSRSPREPLDNIATWHGFN
jgi:nitroreductase